MFFFLVPAFLLGMWLITGIALLAISSSWERGGGRGPFVGFVICLFIIFPVSQGILFSIINLMDSAKYSWYRWIEMVLVGNLVFLTLLAICSQALLIVYAASRRTKAVVHASVVRPGMDGEPIWNTKLSVGERVTVLRQREWSFLLDAAPVVLCLCLCIWLAGTASGDPNSFAALIGPFVYLPLTLLTLLTLAYLIVKDCNQGKSFGKRVAGCRVVDLKSGKPVDAGQAVVRNVIFAFPPLAILELVVASLRADRRRIGDLIAGTIVVQEFSDEDASPRSTKNEQLLFDAASKQVEPKLIQKKHALDD